MSHSHSIKVYKEYFNFSASHFLIFENGDREPLHGHNYRVKLEGMACELNSDMVFDFLHIKPIIREICSYLDHKLLLPTNNQFIQSREEDDNYILQTKKGHFSIPKEDVLFLPIPNTSVERLAMFISKELEEKLDQEYKFQFKSIDIEVEETPGQSAVYRISRS